MKPLFQQQCEALVATLTKAKADENATLKMNVWVDEHSCGTAACVCGYQALSSDLSLFKITMEADECDGSYEAIAADISTELDDSCEELFGSIRLARSIYDAGKFTRLFQAKSAKVADRETLKTFNHLTSDDTTLDDAIKYIEFVIEKCKEKAA